MEAIYSSKLYKTSKYKAEIKAAIQDPTNKELVTQLRSYLSPETLKEITPKKPEEKIDVEVEDTSVDEQTKASSPSGGSGGGHFSAPSGDIDIDSEDADGVIDDIVDDFNEGEPTQLDESVDDEEVQSTVDITDPIDITEDIRNQLNSSVPEVANNISRIATKHDNELWIYFNDDTNLNTVMTPVIDELDDSAQFNRLARSNNAIVFELALSPIKTVDEVDTDVNTAGK